MSTTVETKPDGIIDRMFHAGAHFGYAKSRRHPSAARYIFGVKQRVDIFDLEKTSVLLESAKGFLRNLGLERKVVLIVGGKPESHKVVLATATRVNAPYVVGRWIGGTLTNFSEIKKRILRLEELKNGRLQGDFAKYTKLERLMIDREIDKLEIMYGGLVSLKDRLPSAIIIVDPKKEAIAVKEAHAHGIPVVALASSDCDLTSVEYVVPANDSTPKSIELIIEELAAAFEDGVKNAPITGIEK